MLVNVFKKEEKKKINEQKNKILTNSSNSCSSINILPKIKKKFSINTNFSTNINIIKSYNNMNKNYFINKNFKNKSYKNIFINNIYNKQINSQLYNKKITLGNDFIGKFELIFK